MKKFLCLINLIITFLLSGFSQIVDINVDYDSVTGQIKLLNGVNCGPLPMADAWADLTEQFKEIGVSYVRTHDVVKYEIVQDTIVKKLPWDIDFIFPNFMADVDSPSSYNFLPADSQINAIINTGAKPYIRLGYSGGSSSNYIAAQDRKKWAEICKHIIMHYNDGWANGYYYDIRYYEIWNEPDCDVSDGGWPSSDGIGFFALVDTTTRYIKNYNDSLIIGSAGFSGRVEWITPFLIYCSENNVPIDFISWHDYADTTLMDAYNVVRKFNFIQQILDSLSLPIAQHITEWNSYWTWSGSNGNTIGAVYAVSYLTYLQNTSVTMLHRYRANEDDTLNSGASQGLWFYDGTYKKPAYSFLLFKKLVETPVRIYCTGSDTLGYTAIASKSVSGDTVTVLISDVNSNNTGYNLNVTNLPWENSGFIYERYLLDSVYNAELSDMDNFCSNFFNIQNTMNSPSAHLIRLIKNNTVTTLTETACDSYTLNSQTYTASGVYTQTLTNAAGCDSTVTLNLTISNSNIGDTTATACNSFNWYGVDYNSSGDFTKTFTNASGCDSVVTLHLTIDTIPVVNLGEDTLLCTNYGQTVIILDAGNAEIYLWSDGSIGQTLTVDTANYPMFVQNIIYVSASNGTCSASDTITVLFDICNGIVVNKINNIVIYPNPSNESIIIEGLQSGKIEIMNLQGKVIKNMNITDTKTTIDISKLSCGVYTMKIKTNDGIIIKKIVRE